MGGANPINLIDGRLLFPHGAVHLFLFSPQVTVPDTRGVRRNIFFFQGPPQQRKKTGVSLKRKTRTFQPKRGACRLQPPTFLLTDGVKCYLVKRDPHHYLPLIHPFALFSCLLKTQSSFSKKKVQGPIALSLSRLRSTKIRPTRRRHQLMSDPSKQRLLKEDTGQSDAERARSPDKQKAQRRCHFNWPHFPPPEKKVPQN